MKRFLSILAVVMLLVTFTVGASAEAVNMKIATWTSNEDQLKLLGSFVDEFAAAKGIEINYTFESIAFAEYNTKLLLELQEQPLLRSHQQIRFLPRMKFR